MTLKEQITEDRKAAMRAQDARRLAAVRLLLAAIKQREVDDRRDPGDADVIAVVDKMIKQRRESITGEVMEGEPAPEHLLYAAETREEALPMIAKLCIRPNDTAKGRQIKLNHYMDLYKRYFGRLPPDVHLFIRNEKDIPITYKKDVQNILEEVGWKPRKIAQEPSLMGMDGD